MAQGMRAEQYVTCHWGFEAVGEVFSGAKYQRCIVLFYRNVFSAIPHSKVKLAAK
jgi:putative transposase